MATVTLGLIQSCTFASPAQSLQRHEQLIAEAAGKGAQIICLQELFNIPYFCTRQDTERFDLAEPMPRGPTIAALSQLAAKHEVVLIVPMFEKRGPGLYHNTAAVIDADGRVLGLYRKMHIPQDPGFEEKFYFTPGDLGYRVWNTRFGPIAVLICWDQWYPEAARLAALAGAQILFYPTAIGWHPAEKATFGDAQVDAWRTAQRAHAIANGVFVAAPNRVGHEPEPGTDGLEFFGQSFICDPFGRYLAQAGTEPAILTAQCDLGLIEETRRNWPFLRDRRIDAYGPILNRWLGK